MTASISMLVCGAYRVAVARDGVFIDGAVVTKIGRFGADVLVAGLDQRHLSAAATRTALAVWLMGLMRHLLPVSSLEPTAPPDQLAEFVWGRFFMEETPADLTAPLSLESEKLHMAMRILRDAGYTYAKKQDVRVIEATLAIPDEDYVSAKIDMVAAVRASLAARLGQSLLDSKLVQRRSERRPDIMATVTSARIGIFDPSAFPVFKED